ncbi:MAG: prenyltransferase/squalene oxidase repeat-containing protein [Mariniblastus sp.]
MDIERKNALAKIRWGIALIGVVGLSQFCTLESSAQESSAQESSVQASSVKESAGSLRETVNRSLPFIEAKGAAWIEDKKCLSCHQIPFMFWALNTADRHGLDVDQEKLDQTNRWATEWINLTNPKRREGSKESETLIQEHDAVAGLILGRPKNKDDDATSENWLTNYRDHLIKAQEENGAWEPQGQLPLQKRPLLETRQVATMWAVLALHDYGEGFDHKSKLVTQSTTWLDDNFKEKSIESVEWWAARMLLAESLGNKQKSAEFKNHLISLQQPDGGWGWLSNDPSDAFGTGVAIYALARVKKINQATVNDDKAKDATSQRKLAEHSSIEKALSFLQKTQRKNGSWAVNGTKKSSRGRNSATAVYWGTCWAVIGIMETLEPPAK